MTNRQFTLRILQSFSSCKRAKDKTNSVTAALGTEQTIQGG